MKQLTAGSLFSGIGGIDLAFTLAGLNILFQVEIDTFCQKVLAKHGPTYWPDAKIYSDVCGVGRHNLPSIDVLFGGFPCQDISNAGKRAGIAAGEKSGLWREFKRIIGEMGPRIVFLENVPTITVKGRGGIDVIRDLAEMGYDCRWGVISAADAGAPHQRDRWFCVGYTNRVGYIQSEATGKLSDHQERHDATDQQAGRHILYPALGSGEVEYTNSEQREKYHTATSRSETGLSGGRFGPDGIASVDNTNSQRQQKGSAALIGESAIAGGQDAKDGTEREWPPNKPRLDRSPDGPSIRVDRRHGLIVKHRWAAAPNECPSIDEPPRMAPGKPNTNQRIKALGNGAIPQIVYPLALYLKGMLLAAESGLT